MFGLIDCPSCGKSNSADAAYCEFCGENMAHKSAPIPEPAERVARPQYAPVNQALGLAPQSSAPPQGAESHGRAKKVVARYRDGYLHARSINFIGATIKVLAIIFGVILAWASLVGLSEAFERQSGTEKAIGIGALVGALLIASLGYILGVLVQSVGQSMKANFDGAVNGSPFLNDDQRAEVMSLD